ncbi:hypothetical protein HMPREF3293_00825 [Christensenella minuta]|uniref:Uncharacterized protein n=1 Tax=Christensenella minuta TaxID=626937 RepID=A0A136Q626_9FIRM|nr:hypothetical protein HMPREF3293_00825 [Christensenella minuta]
MSCKRSKNSFEPCSAAKNNKKERRVSFASIAKVYTFAAC